MTTSDANPCRLGVCAANDGHTGTCVEASGWADEPAWFPPPSDPLEPLRRVLRLRKAPLLWDGDCA